MQASVWRAQFGFGLLAAEERTYQPCWIRRVATNALR